MRRPDAPCGATTRDPLLLVGATHPTAPLPPPPTNPPPPRHGAPPPTRGPPPGRKKNPPPPPSTGKAYTAEKKSSPPLVSCPRHFAAQLPPPAPSPAARAWRTDS